jgi:hypothetical protein
MDLLRAYEIVLNNRCGDFRLIRFTHNRRHANTTTLTQSLIHTFDIVYPISLNEIELNPYYITLYYAPYLFSSN